MALSSMFRNPFAASRDAVVTATSDGGAIDLKDVPSDVKRMIKDHRYFHILQPADGVSFDQRSLECALQAIEHHMAMVPSGEVSMVQETAEELPDGTLEINGRESVAEPVGMFYLDRLAVTNADFHKFVKAGGYTNVEFWPEDILPTLLQFVDQTGMAGPRFWTDATPPSDALDHPVVGISWYEANAYALWLGKQLPSPQQWQRAGTWGRIADGSLRESRYPWGNTFNPSCANLWHRQIGGTVPVTDFAQGDTANGIRQLIGNVWEWTCGGYALHGMDGLHVEMPQAMAEIRGGAFDTYFRSQATCQFRTGTPLIARRANVGFRCCRIVTDAEAASETQE